MSAAQDHDVTRIVGLRQSGSLKLLFPRTSDEVMQVVAVNTAGGMTGGDAFDNSIEAGAGAQVSFTTQAAERAYRAKPGQRARLRNRISIGRAARVNWLPQETLLYCGCALDRSLSVEMEPGARLLLAEPLIFGRAAMDEMLSTASFRDRIEIRRDGKIEFLDAMALEGDVAAHLARPTIAAGAGAMVSLIYIAPDAQAHLAHIRAMLPDTAGASLLREDTMYMRVLAPDGFALRATLVPILNRLTHDGLPRPWMI